MKAIMKKKAHSAEFKLKVALAAIKSEETTAQLSQKYGVVSSQIFKWKKALTEQGASIFQNGLQCKTPDSAEVDKLHAIIGRLKVENDFLEKALGKCR
jgi:transposase-like protein